MVSFFIAFKFPIWYRALKLTVTHTVRLCVCYLFNLYANVQLVKRDIVTAVIYCYITTDFNFAKRDCRLSAYKGVMLQTVCTLLYLKWYYDEIRMFPIKAILKHKQVVCMRRKMLFTFFKYLFSFQRYSF